MQDSYTAYKLLFTLSINLKIYTNNMKNKIKSNVKKIRNLFIGDPTKSYEAQYFLTKSHTKYTFGDQKGQVDYLVNNVLNYEKNGLLIDDYYFIDLACADGVTINNTYFLEKFLNWDGLLFEPNLYIKIRLVLKDLVCILISVLQTRLEILLILE